MGRWVRRKMTPLKQLRKNNRFSLNFVFFELTIIFKQLVEAL